MSAITAAAQITQEDLPGMPEDDWWQTYLRLDGERARQIVSAINSDLQFAIVDVNLQHATQTTRANPLSVSVAGIVPMRCSQILLDSSGKATSAIANMATPEIEWHPRTGVTDGSVYITATYDLQHTQPYLAMRKSSDQSFANNTVGPVTFDTTVESLGSALSLVSSSRITVSEAGRYLFAGECGFLANATGERFVWWAKNGNYNGVGNRRGTQGQTSTTVADNASYNATSIWQLSVGDYVEMVAYQNSGAPLNLIGTTSSECNFQCSRLYNTSSPLGRVRLLFIGEPQ